MASESLGSNVSSLSASILYRVAAFLSIRDACSLRVVSKTLHDELRFSQSPTIILSHSNVWVGGIQNYELPSPSEVDIPVLSSKRMHSLRVSCDWRVQGGHGQLFCLAHSSSTEEEVLSFETGRVLAQTPVPSTTTLTTWTFWLHPCSENQTHRYSIWYVCGSPGTLITVDQIRTTCVFQEVSLSCHGVPYRLLCEKLGSLGILDLACFPEIETARIANFVLETMRVFCRDAIRESRFGSEFGAWCSMHGLIGRLDEHVAWSILVFCDYFFFKTWTTLPLENARPWLFESEEGNLAWASYFATLVTDSTQDSGSRKETRLEQQIALDFEDNRLPLIPLFPWLTLSVDVTVEFFSQNVTAPIEIQTGVLSQNGHPSSDTVNKLADLQPALEDGKPILFARIFPEAGRDLFYRLVWASTKDSPVKRVRSAYSILDDTKETIKQLLNQCFPDGDFEAETFASSSLFPSLLQAAVNNILRNKDDALTTLSLKKSIEILDLPTGKQELSFIDEVLQHTVSFPSTHDGNKGQSSDEENLTSYRVM